jgi:hypothetical protein
MEVAGTVQQIAELPAGEAVFFPLDLGGAAGAWLLLKHRLVSFGEFPIKPTIVCDRDHGVVDELRTNGGDVRRVVSQKGPPFLTWRPASLDHILGDT